MHLAPLMNDAILQVDLEGTEMRRAVLAARIQDHLGLTPMVTGEARRQSCPLGRPGALEIVVEVSETEKLAAAASVTVTLSADQDLLRGGIHIALTRLTSTFSLSSTHTPLHCFCVQALVNWSGARWRHKKPDISLHKCLPRSLALFMMFGSLSPQSSHRIGWSSCIEYGLF